MADIDLDWLVRRAIDAVGRLARRGSIVTTGVALVALCISGLTYFVGLQAFDGSQRSVWMVIGAVMVIVAVGAPLLASYRLRSIPRHATALTGELRSLIGKDDEARRIVIDTVAHDDEQSGDDAVTRPRKVIVRGGQYNTLRQRAVHVGDVPSVVAVTRDLASLPALVAIGLAVTAAAGILGFFFTLIWIF